jgi:hypothetical protein
MPNPLTAVLLSAVLSAAALVPAPAAAAASTDIVAELHEVPNLTFLAEDPNPPAGFREFSLEYRQPVDHRHPGRGTFEQQITLLHKDVDAPMVVFTSGYFNYETEGFVYVTESTKLTGGNQLDIEHRFFGNSLPQPTVWSDLDIQQEAADEHAIVTALRPLYRQPWLATGISKGGMTAVYHDRFYPNDYAGTVAYSSPDDITDGGDAYAQFLDRDGTPQCEQDLRRAQIDALRQRGPMETLMAAAAADAGVTFDKDIGSLDKAYEFDIVTGRFVFWQYYNNESVSCATIPPEGAPVQQLYAFFDTIGGTTPGGMLAASDQGLDAFLPYYYQAVAQLDYPVEPQDYLTALMHYPNQESASQYLPRSIPVPRFDPTVMPDIDRWVRTRGSHLIFTYGSLDPYGATPFRLGPGSRDSHVYVRPGGDHLTLISSLSPGQQNTITATIRRWAGLPPIASVPGSSESASASVMLAAGADVARPRVVVGPRR